MNYDYKIAEVNPNKAFAKRSALYLAILSATVALALVILFLLFERYWMLFLPGGMFLLSAVIWFIVGRSSGVFGYHFTKDALIVETNGATLATLSFESWLEERNAESSDFLDKTITKFAFANSRIIMKNAFNENTGPLVFKVVSCAGKRYLLGLDAYALSIVGGMKNEDGLL